ncbi:MAG: RnfABCDGE type electron transport complex subunit D [Ignavibacteria bacterium]|nr:RnfABCDGE type electron transport complex subunit D [Ignavibacteria bacterium]
MEEKIKKEFEFTSSPHFHSKYSTGTVMWIVNLSLIPAVISGVIFFGLYQLVIIFTSIFFAILTEAIIQKILKQKITITDGSAFLTGLLLALTLPPNFSLSATAIGAVFAIAIGKQIFGGLGFNIFNPALAGRAFLQAAFPVEITTWTAPNYSVQSVSSATPLAAFKYDKVLTELKPLVVGNIGGCIGETSALAILVGGIFLIAIGIVNYRIPLAMIIGLFLFGGVFHLIDVTKFPPPSFHLFAGGFMLGAFYMATDYVTSPYTPKGMWIFGLGISLFIVIIRLFGGVPEGVMYSILLMNSFVPLINRYTIPKPFGMKE